MSEKTTLASKLNAVQKEVVTLIKRGKNETQHYDFLRERDVTIMMKELLERHGVLFIPTWKTTSITPSPSGKQIITEVLVEYKFVDIESGDTIVGCASGQGADTGDKGIYKAITGAVKYIFMKTFLIPTDDDPEKDEEGEPFPDKPIKKTNDIL